MTPVVDDVLRYHQRLEGLARATMREMVADIDAALAKAKRELARRVPANAPFTYDRLVDLQGELAALRLPLAERLAGAVSRSLDAVVETAGPATVAGFETLTGSRCAGDGESGVG